MAKTGTSTSSGPSSSSISVHPEDDPLGAVGDQPLHHVDVGRPRLVAHDAVDELAVDHLVHQLAVLAGRTSASTP